MSTEDTFTMRKLILIIALVPTLIYCQEKNDSTVPKLVDTQTKEADKTTIPTADKTATTVVQPIVTTETVQPAEEETLDKDKKTPGVKVVMYLLDGFRKMGENRNKFLNGDLT